MRKTLMFVLPALATLSVGCAPPRTAITGSGDLVTRKEEISAFDKVDVGHAFRVDIRQDETFSVVVRVDDNLLDHLVLEKQGSTLKIGLKPNRFYRGYTGEATVTMPELTELELSGACRGNITGFQSGETLRVSLSGASQLEGDIEAGDARFNLSGASQLTLSGSGDDLRLEASGASIVDLSDFSVDDADLDASGASQATVYASSTLDVDASGASTVTYLGRPRMSRIDTSGASSVQRE